MHVWDWLVRPIDAGGTLDSIVHVESGDSTAAIVIGTRIAGIVDGIRRPDVMAEWEAADLVAYVDHVQRVRTAVTWAEDMAILRARDAGASWGDLAGALGVNRSSVQQRHARLVETYNWPRTAAAENPTDA